VSTVPFPLFFDTLSEVLWLEFAARLEVPVAVCNEIGIFVLYTYARNKMKLTLIARAFSPATT
jgi:hypothetical protein